MGLVWNTVAGATDYVLEIGSQAGATDVLITETPGASYVWRPTGVGDYYVQVSARNATGLGPKSPVLLIASYSFGQFVEALFLGTGPYSDPPNHGCMAGRGRMGGWRDGTNILVTVSNDVSQAGRDQARAVTEQLEQATGGVIRGRFETTNGPVPAPPADGQITVTHFVGNECNNSAAAGCAVPRRWSALYTLAAVAVYLRPDSNPGPVLHEMAHAALAFCHIDRESVTAPRYLAVTGLGYAFGRLTEAEMRAVGAVYRAGLRAGATRSHFVAAGLVDP